MIRLLFGFGVWLCLFASGYITVFIIPAHSCEMCTLFYLVRCRLMVCLFLEFSFVYGRRGLIAL